MENGASARAAEPEEARDSPPAPPHPPHPPPPPQMAPGPKPGARGSDAAIQEENRRRRERIQALSRLLGRVCHDLNNLTMAAGGFLELATNQADKDPARAWGLVAKAEAAIAKAEEYVARVHLLRGGGVEGLPILDLEGETATVVAGLRSALPPEVVLVCEGGAGSAQVLLRPSDHATIVGALVQNALDAREGPLRIVVRTRVEDMAEDSGREDLAPGPYGVLEVEDDGPGMDEGVRARLFEPFFSTRGDDERGFGLATVHGIAWRCRGGVWVASAPGKGTLVRVHIPKAAASDWTIPA